MQMREQSKVSDNIIVGNANVTTGIETGSSSNTIIGSYNAYLNNNPNGIRNTSIMEYPYWKVHR